MPHIITPGKFLKKYEQMFQMEVKRFREERILVILFFF